MNTRYLLAIGTCLALSSGGVAAATALEGDIEVGNKVMAEDAYPNIGGMALKTGLGECLRLGAWTDDNMSNGCEGIEDADAAKDGGAEKVTDTASNSASEAAPAPQKSRIDTKKLNEMALFDVDSDQLNAAGLDAIEGLFGQLAEYKGVTAIDIAGHTDNTGGETYNMSLSERRAGTIAGLLSERYPDANITTVGKGEVAPIATNDTAAGRQKNRRVEINITAHRMTFE